MNAHLDITVTDTGSAIRPRAAPHELNLVDPMGDVTDFLSTAGIVSHLDAVLTIGTSVAHLAGEMGKRTLVLLPYGASWCWGQAEGGSSWYPPARLFRQRQPGEWRGVATDCAAGFGAELRSGPPLTVTHRSNAAVPFDTIKGITGTPA
jgi:hypothetical protein